MSNYDNTYEELQGMVDNMNVLFDDLKLPLLECNLAIPGVLLLFIENIASSGAIEKNIVEINKQLGDIINEYETRIKAEYCEDAIPNTQEKKETEGFSDNLFEGNEAVFPADNESVFENTVCESENFITPAKNETNSDDETVVNMIKSVIAMRDNLILRQGMIEMQNPEMAEQSAKIIDTVLLETSHLLEQNNVTVLNNTGVFDTATQTITGTEKTSDKALENTIVKTARMGYRYKEKLIRPQEVIIYSCTQ